MSRSCPPISAHCEPTPAATASGSCPRAASCSHATALRHRWTRSPRTPASGIGTVYRHFPTKEALLTEMVRVRFQEFAAIATLAEDTVDPRDALETVMRRSAEAVEGDVGFQLAMMGSNELEWEGIEEQKAVLAAVLTRIIGRAVSCRRRPRRLHLRGFRDGDVRNHLDDVLQARQCRLASPPSDHSPRRTRSSPGCRAAERWVAAIPQTKSRL